MPLPNIGKIFSKLKFLQLPINIRSTLVKMIGIIKTETLNKLLFFRLRTIPAAIQNNKEINSTFVIG